MYIGGDSIAAKPRIWSERNAVIITPLTASANHEGNVDQDFHFTSVFNQMLLD